MAWEISHTNEAWEIFRRGLEAQTLEWLQEACATCVADLKQEAAKQENEEHWDEDDWEDIETDWEADYEQAMEARKNVAHDTLVNEAYSWCETHMTCSNGGFDFYVDSEGYYSICLSEFEEEIENGTD